MTRSLRRLSPRSSAPRLLCLPYAGGRGDFYRRWVPDLMGILELWTTDLPGRHRLADQPPATDLDAVVDRIAVEATDLLDRPLAVFGHSMGALLGIEVVRTLERAGSPLRALIVSGCSAPQVRTRQAATADRSDGALVALLRSWGGTPPELLDNREFLDLTLPTLRADLLLCDQFRARPGRVRTPLTALAGSVDTTAPVVEVEAWSACSTEWRGLRILPGGHFFIHSGQRAVIDTIAATTRCLTP